MTAPEILDREFLRVRAKLLEIAATFDRLDRADGSAHTDARIKKFRQALAVLGRDEPGRAEEIQLLFSLPYDEAWMKRFAIEKSNGFERTQARG